MSQDAKLYRQYPYGGLPYKHFDVHSKPPLYKKTDGPQIKPKIVKEGFCKVFNLDDENDQKRYNEICNNAAKGYATICKEVVSTTPEGNFKVFVRWAEYYYTDPITAHKLEVK
jgi:hypothetical protein